MKRRRKRWLWAIIAFACVTITFGVAELTGASIIAILGWGLLGILGFLADAMKILLRVPSPNTPSSLVFYI